jgi:hypothetical protein
MSLSDCSVKELTASFSISQHLREPGSARLVALKKVSWNIDTGLRAILCEKCSIGRLDSETPMLFRSRWARMVFHSSPAECKAAVWRDQEGWPTSR